MQQKTKEIMTFKEAGLKGGGISGAALRFMATTKRLTEGIDYRKSGDTWLITRKAMEKLYGEEPIIIDGKIEK